MDPIQISTEQLGGTGHPSAGQAKTAPAETSFGDFIQQSIAEVNELQSEADDAVQKLQTGDNKDIHGTLIALEKADISFQLLMQIRNKIVAAYQEIMRMQI